MTALTFAGLQRSQTCTGTPFFALETRPVIGISFIDTSSAGRDSGMGRIGAFGRGKGVMLELLAPEP